MKVCHLTSVHNSSDTRIFHKECVSLAKAGNKVLLVAPGISRTEKGVNVIGIGVQPKNRIARMLLTTKRIYKKSLEQDADIYHLHDPELLPYALKLKRNGKCVIFDSHENILEYMESKSYIPKLARKIISSIFKRYATHILRKIDGIISVTPSFCNDFKAINPNTVIITNYPFSSDTSDSSEKNKKQQQLCFTGGISEQWCIDLVLNAINDIPETNIVLCGSFDNDEYERKLKEMPAWSKCNYLGILPFHKVKAIQQSSSIGLCILKYSQNTNFKEGTLGNTKLFEYMSSGTAVVCTDFSIWSAIIDRYHCGIVVPPNNPNAIRNAIHYLLSHPEECIEMGKNGKKAVNYKFNWDTQADSLVKFYRQIADNASLK